MKIMPSRESNEPKLGVNPLEVSDCQAPTSAALAAKQGGECANAKKTSNRISEDIPHLKYFTTPEGCEEPF
jgi:hypothetical protein